MVKLTESESIAIITHVCEFANFGVIKSENIPILTLVRAILNRCWGLLMFV